jgi:hypothetical protein
MKSIKFGYGDTVRLRNGEVIGNIQQARGSGCWVGTLLRKESGDGNVGYGRSFHKSDVVEVVK